MRFSFIMFLLHSRIAFLSLLISMLWQFGSQIPCTQLDPTSRIVMTHQPNPTPPVNCGLSLRFSTWITIRSGSDWTIHTALRPYNCQMPNLCNLVVSQCWSYCHPNIGQVNFLQTTYVFNTLALCCSSRIIIIITHYTCKACLAKGKHLVMGTVTRVR